MRLVRIEDRDSASIWVNPDNVETIQHMADDASCILTTVSGEEYIIKGAPADLARALRGDTD